MTRRATLGLIAMGVLCAGSTAQSRADDVESAPTLAALFQRARDASGGDYRGARDALLAHGLPASTFLEARAADAGADADERWLAAILLDRANRAETYPHLEKVFAEKVFSAEFGGPRITASGRPPKAAIFEPGHAWPPPQPQTQPGFRGEDFRIWQESLVLPESASWRPFLGEILLKGWPIAADQASKKLGREVLTSDDYLRHAIHLLGRLGEERAGPALLRLLRDAKPPSPDGREQTWLGLRPRATEALGRLKYAPALDTLLELAEDPQTHYALMPAVFTAIRRIGDRRAIPTLERIAARPFAPNDGKTANSNAINHGTLDAKEALRILKGEEKAPLD